MPPTKSPARVPHTQSQIVAPPLSGTAYGEFLAEKEEIQRLKWLVSEKEDRDIGFEFALNEWATKHRAKWRGMRNQLRRKDA